MKDRVEKMEDGKDKELMKILEGKAKPFLQKIDGYACKMEEDKEITYKSYNGQELTLKVPKGSYIMTEQDSCYPKIVTSEEFEKRNKFVGGDEKPKKEKEKEDGSKIGMELMSDENSEY